jgi:SAM-dependent methyltransferase
MHGFAARKGGVERVAWPAAILAAMSAYAHYDADAERRRLRLQSEALEPLSERALARLGPLEGARALDVACGAMGLLPALSRWVGPRGRVVGADINEAMIAEARALISERAIENVEIVRDDLFASALPARSFDVVHSRFVLAPLGRDAEVAAQLERLAKPEGWILLEEPDGLTTLRVWPDNAAHARLLGMLTRAFERHMGGADAGTRLAGLAQARGWRDVHFDAHVLGLPPGHPYLACPAMMATALRAALLKDTNETELDEAIRDVQAACARPETYGVTFTLMQVWGRPPAAKGSVPG